MPSQMVVILYAVDTTKQNKTLNKTCKYFMKNRREAAVYNHHSEQINTCQSAARKRKEQQHSQAS